MKFNKINIWILFSYFSVHSVVPTHPWTVGILDPVCVCTFFVASEACVAARRPACTTQRIELIHHKYTVAACTRYTSAYNNNIHTEKLLLSTWMVFLMLFESYCMRWSNRQNRRPRRILTAIVLHAYRHCVPLQTTDVAVAVKHSYRDAMLNIIYEYWSWLLWIMWMECWRKTNQNTPGNETTITTHGRIRRTSIHTNVSIVGRNLAHFFRSVFFCICLFFHVIFSCTVLSLFHFATAAWRAPWIVGAQWAVCLSKWFAYAYTIYLYHTYINAYYYCSQFDFVMASVWSYGAYRQYAQYTHE